MQTMSIYNSKFGTITTKQNSLEIHYNSLSYKIRFSCKSPTITFLFIQKQVIVMRNIFVTLTYIGLIYCHLFIAKDHLMWL